MRYFQIYAESHKGEEGNFYCEVSSDSIITKQVNVFGDKFYWATLDTCSDSNYPFTDQPEFDYIPEDGVEISAQEFEEIWNRSRSQCQ